MRKRVLFGLFLAVFAIACLFRFPELDRRPMHHDEANQAVKFGNLLEHNDYRYDRIDHHGPSLYYLTLPPAWILSGRTVAALDETVLRLVPALFALGTLMLFWLLRDALGRSALVAGGLLFAVSPVVVFYNRFYIQESLLIFGLLGLVACGWRYLRQPSYPWAVACGGFAGLMYATKETSIIIFGAVAGAVALVRLIGLRSRTGAHLAEPHRIGQVMAAAGTALLVSVGFFSSFFQNMNGPLDSLRAFGTYFERAGDPGWHAHPWYYYVKMLAFSKYGPGPAWSEGLVLALACVGAVAVWRRQLPEGVDRRFLRFLFFYTILATAAYSVISYKTPWNLLPFYAGMLLLAGYGAAFFLQVSTRMGIRILVFLMLMTLSAQLAWQSYRTNFIYYADSRNPYVYAHTSSDFMNLVERIRAISDLHPEKRNLLIKVVAGPYETWPLPWYLRKYTRVGYWQEAAAAGDLEDAAIVITSLDQTDQWRIEFAEDYLTEYYGLRPEVLLALHIRRDLWEEFIKKRTER